MWKRSEPAKLLAMNQQRSHPRPLPSYGRGRLISNRPGPHSRSCSWSQCTIGQSWKLSRNLKTRIGKLKRRRGGPFIARKDHRIFFLFFGGANLDRRSTACRGIQRDCRTRNGFSRAAEKQKERSIPEPRGSINGPPLRGLMSSPAWFTPKEGGDTELRFMVQNARQKKSTRSRNCTRREQKGLLSSRGGEGENHGTPVHGHETRVFGFSARLGNPGGLS